TSVLACDGLVIPLTLRTYCSAAACTSSEVACGSKLYRVRMLRHMVPSSPLRRPSTRARSLPDALRIQRPGPVPIACPAHLGQCPAHLGQRPAPTSISSTPPTIRLMPSAISGVRGSSKSTLLSTAVIATPV